MKIAITGADGQIGRVLTGHWNGIHEVTPIGDKFDLTVPGAWEEQLAEAETVIHLAAKLREVTDFGVLQANTEMMLNVARAAANVRRIVYASSMWAMHERTSLGPRGNYYSASKLAGEAIVKGWSDTHLRPAVSLRIGKFGDPSPFEHELLRVDEATLKYWFDKAIAYQEPAHCYWLAFGMSNHLAAPANRS